MPIRNNGGETAAVSRSAARETSRRINIPFRFPLRERLKHAIYICLIFVRAECSLAGPQRQTRVPHMRPSFRFNPSVSLFFSALFSPSYTYTTITLAALVRPTTPHIWLPSTWSELISEFLRFLFTGYWKPFSLFLFALSSSISLGRRTLRALLCRNIHQVLLSLLYRFVVKIEPKTGQKYWSRTGNVRLLRFANLAFLSRPNHGNTMMFVDRLNHKNRYIFPSPPRDTYIHV